MHWVCSVMARFFMVSEDSHPVIFFFSLRYLTGRIQAASACWLFRRFFIRMIRQQL